MRGFFGRHGSGAGAVFVLLTLLASEPDPAIEPEDAAESEGVDGAWSVDRDVLADDALADADREEEAIAARARRARLAAEGAWYWPRIVVSLSVGALEDAALDRTAGAPDRSLLGHPRGLVWSILATWGEP